MGQGILELDRAVRTELRGWLDGLSGIARTVNEGAPLTDVLDVIAATTCELTGYDFSAILLPNEQRTALLIVGSCGMRPEYIREVNSRRPIRIGPGEQGEAPTSRAFRYQRPVHIRDLWSASSCAPWEAVAHEQGNRSLLSLPLIGSQGPRGALNCYTRVPRDFSGEDVVFMETLANQAALAIEAATLHASARARNERLDNANRELRTQRDALRQADEAHQELMRLVLDGRELDDLAGALAGIVSSIVVVSDGRGCVLAASPWEFPQMLRRYVTAPAVSDACAEIGQEQEPRTELLRIPVSERGAGLPALVVPVSLDGEVVARLWVVHPRADMPHTAAERRIVEGAALVVALMIAKQRTAHEAEWRVSRDLLDELLLRGNRIDATVVYEWGRRFGVDLREPHVLLVAGPDSTRSPEPASELSARVLLGRVRQALNELPIRAVATARGSEAVVLVPAGDDEGGRRSPGELAGFLLRALRHPDGQDLCVVISPECEQVDDYPKAYDIAHRALGLAAMDGRTKGVVDVRRLGVYRLLLNAARPAELTRFARDLLGPLERYEAKHAGEILRTLEAFLDMGGSPAGAAQRLFVHSNTVRYRIRRVEELLGVSLAKDEDRLQLKLALMIRTMTQGGSGPGG